MEEKLKTVREWFEELPEPYRTKAFENVEKKRIRISCR